MARTIAVFDTSSIIALAAIGQLSLTQQLFDQMIVPLDVWAEFTTKSGQPLDELVLALRNLVLAPHEGHVPPGVQSLGAGERQVITIALTRGPATVVLDDRRARKAATELGLHVTGTVGILLEARRQDIIPGVRGPLALLRKAGFRIGEDVIDRVCREAGE